MLNLLFKILIVKVEEFDIKDAVRNFDIADQILQSSTDSEDAVRKMQNAEESFDHALQQVVLSFVVQMYSCTFFKRQFLKF